MSPTESRLYRLSPSQLRALFLLAKSEDGIIVSTATSKELGKEGKALGGVFSALSRQVISGEHLVLPWGRSEDGHGLRWKLNDKLISKEKLLQITRELLNIK
ncbi:hypothetical protein A2334_01150 [Candidatus Roizmanbacteria bacterium RIFOXYB2_FULL_38_10]|uniref:Uncharacterized protein n=1 Tax=Candidatus Roizmanbacteria bacterium RIFOXYD1_FULL_38_12 TaxID=1802093 RepID=A0A1F7L1I7_9BACT|nr:MAG: hypothetical protein A3K47_04445 [Candidatus Roizmanbacteria bacterium RIFOXYA2_FULL_38_14]OGK64002.1 MAG: hypothetical protein A3K27_04445 [Candidatus Roizmanbacteria bacterium RIFOXYA1_FULL_37_12]OGK65848.1 MAG: hypothetical protein A3K38_04445 [Candidatus Roizmanbacteria bacterium RIFOXYB1_FULL_40_23]OGK68955.1 MAG: hypothetical protein A2334_01150 [Candidatus Roizmanbacteria bacterium RIFOXYB2_FULL_38_10]OGK70253.1 MAG: hypothetical protein A3K21_04450 [Candidatus Roizmanbacteria ba